MGQQLFKVQLDITDNAKINFDTVLSDSGKDDISLFFPLKTSSDLIELKNDQQNASFQTKYVRQIQDHLAQLTRSDQWEETNTEINKILTENIFTFITDRHRKILEDSENYLTYRQQLQTSLTKKIKSDNLINVSIFAQPFIDSSSENSATLSNNDNVEQLKQQKAKYQTQQVSYFAVQSLISLLLILIKSAEKNDPTIVHEILTLAGQLCDQLPMKSLSGSNTNNFLFNSLKPLINYINQLSLKNDSILSKQALKILLSFSIAKGSFKDLLPLLCKLIFNTTDLYNVQGLIIQLNDGLTETIHNWETQKQQIPTEEGTDSNLDKDDDTTSQETTNKFSSISLNYLKSIGSFPTTELLKLNDELFTGQFISSIILAHIDIENEINSPSKLSQLSSISCEIHPATFETLFNIIEQLTTTISSNLNQTVVYILTIYLRLFTTHLQILSDVISGGNHTDLAAYKIDIESKKWFDLLLKLACNENTELLTVCHEASKGLVHVINIQTSSLFIEKLSLIHQYIVENKYPILIKQFLIELNKNETLLNWIDILCQDDNSKTTALNILYSFIDIYFNLPKTLVIFQQILLFKLVDQCGKKNITYSISISSLIIQYLTYIFKNYTNKMAMIDDLFNSILTGLCLMTKTDEIFHFEAIQSIFIAVLPLLAEYYLQNQNTEYDKFVCYLLGKMSHVLILGLPQDALEIKHINKLKLSIFAGGCIIDMNDYLVNSNLAIYSQFQLANDTQEDKEFLMSVYNNTNEGAQLISKLKLFIKDKQHLLQKSIEQQVNDACAAVFAVYLKHYRRLNLAKYELTRTDETKPHNQLLSIYEYATSVQTLFATIKAQGGDCDEIYKQIKIKTLFLLLSVKESNLIPIIEDELPSSMVNLTAKIESRFHRQVSRWSKAKHVIKLLKHLLQACIRFKRLMLEKKHAIEQKYDYESLLNRTIDQFIYEDSYKTSTTISTEEKQLEIDELQKCLSRQHERALTRLITYRFIKTFIQNVLQTKDHNQCLNILAIYLPYLRNKDLEWSYLDNIQASNDQLKEELSNCYYSIIKMIVTFTLQSKILVQNIFYLLNLSYESIDIYCLYHDQFAEILFLSFVSLINNPKQNTSLDLRLTAFNWFRLFVLQLCQNIETEKLRGTSNQVLQQQQKIVFNTLILNELKGLKQMKDVLAIDSEEQKRNSLKDVALGWFIQANETNVSIISNKYEIELCTNQYLVLLLRSMHFYKHVLSVCATVEFLEELLAIYHYNQWNTTRLLIVKILRHLIPYIPDNVEGTSKDVISKLLIDVLSYIGENITSQESSADTIVELIYMYRTIISLNSSWQIMATELVFDSITSHLNLTSIKINDTNQMNKLLASLCILGGYIEPYRLGSMVKIYSDEDLSDEPQLALIIKIDSDLETPYAIQYLQTNQTESVSRDKLQLEIDVPPPNLLSLPVINETILDTLGDFIQIDTSTSESVILLQLKRRSVSVVYHILNERKAVEMFMKKPYASIIAKLAISDSLVKQRRQPADLHSFNKEHLEQYCLSLDTCERSKQITENEDKTIVHHSITTNDQDDSSYTIWNVKEITRDQSVIDALSTSISKSNGWKPYASEAEIELFKKGRIGDDKIRIVPMPRGTADAQAIEECGIKHRFRGRLVPNSQNTRLTFPTFIINNLQLSEGKWYYCVRLPVAGLIQIGWATNGFSPHGSCGVGDDEYSWSYDGSRAVLFNEDGFYGQFNDLNWKPNDICGCGIEIDGKNTNIKYWLNGKLLGTAFAHNLEIPLSTTKCDLLPNGPSTTYYPSVTIQWPANPARCCELVVSPEDMQDCPLPDGYKPLLLPQSIHIENSLVDYPFSAYLVSDNQQDCFYTPRMKCTNNLLRDFVNKHHLETTFTLDNHYLILPDKSDGFLFSVDNDEGSSLTISFDFQILSTDDKLDIPLFTFDSTEITWKKNTDEKIQCLIIFLSKKRQIKVYINNKCQIYTDAFQHETIKKLNLHILPGMNAGIKNLAIWKYALSEEHIRRLFTYGLFYVAVDYEKLKEYQKQVKTISFTKNQQKFLNELLVPFNEPFEEDIWEKKKKQADNDDDDDESKYFNTKNDNDYSTIELFGNKTYLVLDKSNEEWSKYTLVLDISIPNYPTTDEKLTLIKLNPTSELYITHDGNLCLDSDGTKTGSDSTINLDEYVRLFISVQEESLQVYLNDELEIEIEITDDRFQIKSNRIDLFCETDFTKSTTNEDTLRVSLKSITYLNRSISLDELKSATLHTLPFAIIGTSLMAMGYKKTWIQSVLQQNKSTDISVIHTILCEQKQQFIKTDLENERQHYMKILSRLNPSIDPEVLKELINSSKFDTNEQLSDIVQHISIHSIGSQPSELSIDRTQSDANWFSQSVHDLGIKHGITEWIRDKTSITSDEDNIYQLLNLNQSDKEQIRKIKSRKSMQYSHKNISSKQFLDSRISCEHGLTTIYARNTILNMLKVWSYHGSTLFPLEKFGDYPSLVTLLKLLDRKKLDTNENIEQTHLLITSILKSEIKQLLEHIDTINSDILQSKAPLFYHLHNDLVTQSIQFLIQPSVFELKPSEEQLLNSRFLLKILRIFTEIISDKSSIKQQQIDSLVPFLFPISLVNLIFDLFLLVPTPRSKIYLLYALTTLVQTSEYFKLNNQIQQFVFHLLIELSSDEHSNKKLKVALTDLIFVLLTKQKSTQEFQSKLPADIQTLFTTIEVIIAWTDQTKQMLLSEAFLLQSKDILGNNFKVNQDDFKKSNDHFNAIADQDLINFMNTNTLLDNSFTSFIESLPTESEPNSTFYKTYVSLSSIPADCIQIRARFVYLLNKSVEKCLPTIDFSLPSGKSILTDKIRTIKLYLLSSTKLQLFNDSLERTEAAYNSGWNVVNFDTVKASTDTENSENTMFYQAYQQLHANAHITFRQLNDQLWHAQYVGMHSTDQGGPYRDSITRICWDICSTRLSLFILCPNGRTNSGLNRDCWIPNNFPPNKLIPIKFKKQYRFIGQLMGMAIRKKHYLDLKFPSLLWKQLLKEQITIEDIIAIDIQSFTIINEMEKNIEQIKSIDTDNDIDSVFSSIMSELRFDVVSSSGKTYELIPGGTEIPITASNFKEYCSCYRQYRLNEFNRQIDQIRQGLYSIVPCYYLSLFTASELEEAVCGKGRIDVELLKRNTSCGGEYSQDSPVIERFWSVLDEMFNDDQKKLFLIFVWGRSTLPCRDEDFHCKFTINNYDAYDNDVDRMLPRSHTCYFTIDLPAFSTTEIMFERLNYAISCCSSIDGDGLMNDAPDIEQFNLDDR